jgi:hypothetical protein
METFPLELFPRPSSSLPVERRHPTIRTEFEDGHARQRRRYESAYDFYRVNWNLTDLQMAYLRSWITNVVNGGEDWFQIELPFGDSFYLQTARIVDGTLQASHRQRTNFYWNASVILEVQDAPNDYSSDSLAVLISEDGDPTAFLAAQSNLTDEVTHFNVDHPMS